MKPDVTPVGASLIRCYCIFDRMNYCLKVATRADQFTLPLSVKLAVYAPVEVTSSDSFAPREPDVFASRRAYPLPAVCVPAKLDGSPAAPKTSSFTLVVTGVAPLLGAALLPCAEIVWSSGLVVLNPLYS